MHLIDVLIGRLTDKVKQFEHDKLSVFAIGSELNEKQWRAVMRQLVARGFLYADAEHFNALKLTEEARGVLRGEVELMFREETGRIRAPRKNSRRGELAALRGDSANPDLVTRLRTWRAGVARGRNVPAYVVLHDATIDGIASEHPTTLDQLREIPGIGDKKLEHYGADILAIVNG
jgi:ATP-dependent DNA helicase RecQ